VYTVYFILRKYDQKGTWGEKYEKGKRGKRRKRKKEIKERKREKNRMNKTIFVPLPASGSQGSTRDKGLTLHLIEFPHLLFTYVKVRLGNYQNEA
jgi:hypothetical protein